MQLLLLFWKHQWLQAVGHRCVCVQGQSYAVKLHETLKTLSRAFAILHFHDDHHHYLHHDREIIVPNSQKMCSYTLFWWASGNFKGNPIRPYQAEGHGKGHLHKHLITLILTAISLVSFVSIPQTSSCQQSCQHYTPEQHWWLCL